MSSVRFIFALLLFSTAVLTSVFSASSSVPAVAKAVRQFHDFYPGDTNEAPPEPARAGAYAHSLTADGSWTDIEYLSKAHSDRPSSTHSSSKAPGITTFAV